jgi:hypothetical protein
MDIVFLALCGALSAAAAALAWLCARLQPVRVKS